MLQGKDVNFKESLKTVSVKLQLNYPLLIDAKTTFM